MLMFQASDCLKSILTALGGLMLIKYENKSNTGKDEKRE